MARRLVDLLWRDHADAPERPARGPRSRHTTGDVVAQALALADAGGLDAVTVRALAASLAMPTMSVYTHVNSRDDLLVLMLDAAHADAARPRYGRAGWRTRVSRVAEANLALVVGDLDAEYERIAGAGARVLTPPETEPWGERYCQFADANGLVWQLVQWMVTP